MSCDSRVVILLRQTRTKSATPSQAVYPGHDGLLDPTRRRTATQRGQFTDHGPNVTYRLQIDTWFRRCASGMLHDGLSWSLTGGGTHCRVHETATRADALAPRLVSDCLACVGATEY